jgi:hypothetical protein
MEIDVAIIALILLSGVSGASTPFGFWLDLLAGVRSARAISSGALLWLARGGPGPGKKLVEAIVGPEVN